MTSPNLATTIWASAWPCRKLTFRIFLYYLIATICPLFAESYGNIQDVKLVRVYDGDRFFVDISGVHPVFGEEVGIRVRDIDIPEIRGKCEEEKNLAFEARDIVQNILSNAGRIDLIDVERGKYFRIVATVLADGMNLGDILIDADVAVPYDGKTKRIDWCKILSKSDS